MSSPIGKGAANNRFREFFDPSTRRENNSQPFSEKREVYRLSESVKLRPGSLSPAGVRLKASRLQNSSFKLQVSGLKLQSSGFKLPAPGFRLPA
jgi:hypothetical protein